MTALTVAACDYLRLRRSVGYKLNNADRLLSDLVDSLTARGETTITVAAVVAWAGQANTESGVLQRLTTARGFAKYVAALDPHTQVPPCGLVPMRRRRPPYLFTEPQVAALMAAARRLRSPRQAVTCETVIGLLWATGMRIGEVCRLDVADFDADASTLTVWFTKFGKSRLVPVTASVSDALADYANTRRSWRSSSARLFVSGAGTALTSGSFRSVFVRVLAKAGIPAVAVPYPPRVHDLRHSFAVDTLLRWYRAGQDVQALLPRLSTYLGHVGPTATYWYLSAVPELLALAAERVEVARP